MKVSQEIAERRLLGILFKSPEYLYELNLEKELFENKHNLALYNAVKSLYDNNLQVSSPSIIQKALVEEPGMPATIVADIEALDTFDSKPKVEEVQEILNDIKNIKKLNVVSSQISKLKSDFKDLGYKDEDLQKLKLQLDDISLSIDRPVDSKKTLSMEESTNQYLEIFSERENGKKYKFFDKNLDDLVTKGPEPGAGTVLFGPSGSGKSAFALSMVNNFINNDVPCIYYSLEMSLESIYDRLIALRTTTPVSMIANPKPGDEFESIKEKILDEKKSLDKHKYYKFNDTANLSLKDIEVDIRNFYSALNIDYCVIVVDLLSMVKEFMSISGNANTAVMIEFAVNQLNALSKLLNFHWVGVLQANRDAESTKVNDLTDLEKMRPSRINIKNANAYLERARCVLSIYRPKFFAYAYLQDSKEQWEEEIDDIMYCSVLKQNNGKLGEAKYLFEPETLKVTALFNYED